MRLLNVHTLKLRDFKDADRPPYAIASHRWTSDEATLQDFDDIDDDAPYAIMLLKFIRHSRIKDRQETKGYTKITAFCEVVKRWKFPIIDWLWIDTCCIDKTNSTELSEAINSMYRWYSEAYVCLAYLADIACDLWFTRRL